MQLSLSSEDGAFRIYGREGDTGTWTLHAEGGVVAADLPARTPAPTGYEAQAECKMGREEFYALFRKRGNLWGPAFQGVRQAWINQSEGWAEIDVPESVRGDLDSYCFHPAIADACGHVLAAIAPFPDSGRGAFVGQAIERVCLYNRPRGGRMLAHAQLTPTFAPSLFSGDVRVFDEDGTLLSHLHGAQLRYLELDAEAGSEWFYQLTWSEVGFGAEKRAAGEWIILSRDRTGLTDALERAMDAEGVRHRFVTERPAVRLREALESSRVAGVVSLLGLDARGPRDDSEGPSCEATSLLELMQIMPGQATARLWVITSGLEEVQVAPDEAAIWQAPQRGLARSFAVEFPELWGGLVDLDPANSNEQNAFALWRHLRSPEGEDQVALRGDTRFAARLQPYQSTGNHRACSSRRLRLPDHGRTRRTGIGSGPADVTPRGEAFDSYGTDPAAGTGGMAGIAG